MPFGFINKRHTHIYTHPHLYVYIRTHALTRTRVPGAYARASKIINVNNSRGVYCLSSRIMDVLTSGSVDQGSGFHSVSLEQEPALCRCSQDKERRGAVSCALVLVLGLPSETERVGRRCFLVGYVVLCTV